MLKVVILLKSYFTTVSAHPLNTINSEIIVWVTNLRYCTITDTVVSGFLVPIAHGTLRSIMC